MDILSFDEISKQNDRLNNDTSNRRKWTNRSVPFRKYFEEMDIDEESVDNRIRTANSMLDAIAFLFALLRSEYKTNNDIDREYYVDLMRNRYRDVLDDENIRSSGAYDHADRASEIIVDNTIKNIDDEGYTSEDRATFDAECEANCIWNWEELEDAMESGYTHKTWQTMRDKKVRETHSEVNGTTIPIYEAFEVGGYQMMMPLDDSMGAGAEEISNCRCSLKFS